MPRTPARDVAAIALASGYEKHGTTVLGGSFVACICAKKPCGGVSENQEHADCPEHRRTPAQRWHWASECPGAAGS